MTNLKLIQINDADYGEGRVVIEAQHLELDWAVPAWEEMGLSELEGCFISREEAESALRSIPVDLLAEYGFVPAQV